MHWQKRIRSFFTELGYFFSSKIFLINLIAMVGILLMLMIIFFWAIQNYTRHNESIEVVSLKHRTIEQAMAWATSRNFKLVVADSLYVKNGTGGLIIDQYPLSGARVKPGRTIYLTIQTYNPPLVPLTYNQIIGKTRSNVEKQLLGLDISVLSQDWVPCRPDNTITALYYKGKTIFKEADVTKEEEPPKEAVKIPRGAKVTLVICQDEATQGVEVPDLVCFTYQQARFKIAAHELLFAGTGFINDTEVDTNSCVVCSQSPHAGKRVSMGTGVSFRLCKKDCPTY